MGYPHVSNRTLEAKYLRELVIHWSLILKGSGIMVSRRSLGCLIVAFCILVTGKAANAAISVTSNSLPPSDHILTSYTVGYDNFGERFQWIGDSGSDHTDLAQSFLVSGADNWMVDKITVKVSGFGTSVLNQNYTLEMWTVSNAADWSGNTLVSSQSATFPSSGLVSGYWTFDVADVTLSKEQYYAFVLGFDSGPDSQRFVTMVHAYSAYDLYPDGRMFLRMGTPPSWSSPFHASDKDFEFYIQGSPVPEPATIIIWSLLGAGSWLGMRVWRRPKHIGRQPWSPETRNAIHEIIARGTHPQT